MVNLEESLLRTNFKRPPKEAVYNPLSWVRDDDYRGVNEFTEGIAYPLRSLNR